MLYSCLACGARFVADPEHEYYMHDSLAERIAQLSCPECSSALRETLKPYPDALRTSDGYVGHFEPPREYPPDNQSIVVELWNLDSK